MPVTPAALSARHIRGAALDVFASEPLPADSPLWDLPNVFMSPHCADRCARTNGGAGAMVRPAAAHEPASGRGAR